VSDLQLGRIAFGPHQTPEEARRNLELSGRLTSTLAALGPLTMVQGCNCRGPESGQIKCPCALAAEMNQGMTMIQNGVTINGRKYRLVPEE
jgi:hypothetical protein